MGSDFAGGSGSRVFTREMYRVGISRIIIGIEGMPNDFSMRMIMNSGSRESNNTYLRAIGAST